MKNIRVFGLSFALGLALTLSNVGLARNPAHTAQADKTESCCSMDSCCKAESCSMKDHAKKEHATKEHTKSESAGADKHSCCCGGDSCDMKMKHNTEKNHSANDDCCCKGDSCSMSHEMKEHGKGQMQVHTQAHQGMHEAMKAKASMHGNKEGCCCCSGDSCEMKMTHEQEKAKG
jgi:hypothetical protein